MLCYAIDVDLSVLDFSFWGLSEREREREGERGFVVGRTGLTASVPTAGAFGFTPPFFSDFSGRDCLGEVGEGCRWDDCRRGRFVLDG